MNIFSDLRSRLNRLAAWSELDVDAAALPSTAARLSDSSVVEVLAEVGAILNDADRLQTVLAGVAAARSSRERGQGGLAAGQGFPSPEKLIQSITGGTKADAVRQVRVGRALVEDAADPAASGALEPEALPGAPEPDPEPERVAWHEPLRRAVLNGTLTTAQHDAIRRGLGEPLVAAPEGNGTADPGGSIAAVHDVWMLAAEGLVREAAAMPVEELVKRARTVRDLLDPVGATERYSQRFGNRRYRMWVDADGQHRGDIAFDDEMALFVQAALNAGLRPRRGGPRFMTDEERAAAAELVDDGRTNDQLAYDLLVDLIRAGVLATAKDVFGAREPGVRMLVVEDDRPRDALGRLLSVGHAEDGGCALPGPVIERNACANGTIEVILDGQGNPLDLGRLERLYSPRQRLTLAVRDGGCLWPGCDRPPSYGEAHHIDPYAAGGKTDIDRGVLLCRFHHMKLHNHGWRITRDGKGPFVLHPPPGEGAAIVLVSKSAWAWAWTPPHPPRRPGWRTPPDVPARVTRDELPEVGSGDDVGSAA